MIRFDEIIQQVRGALEGKEAADVALLTSLLSLSRETIEEALAVLMRRGEVEVLRPVGCDSKDHDFYRYNTEEGKT
jgi:hypothetical protein